MIPWELFNEATAADVLRSILESGISLARERTEDDINERAEWVAGYVYAHGFEKDIRDAIYAHLVLEEK